MVSLPALIGFTPAFGNQVAKANFINSLGKMIGQASLVQTEQGILIKSHLTGLSKGEHAFHIHTIGNCVVPDFTLAGGHYSPSDKEHGYENPKGSHLDDMPNVFVGKEGILDSEVLLNGATITELMDQDGSAIVLHAVEDDYRSDPARNAGTRIVVELFNSKVNKQKVMRLKKLFTLKAVLCPLPISI